MMNHAGLNENYRRKLWCETISTATKLDNLMLRKMGAKPPHFNFFNEHPRYRKHLRTLGEMAVIASHGRKKTRTKNEERERTAMFVGYADDHTGDVYRFIHIKTGQIILSRDVRWLNAMWKVNMQKQRRLNQNLEESESDSDLEDDHDEFQNSNKTGDVVRDEEED